MAKGGSTINVPGVLTKNDFTALQLNMYKFTPKDAATLRGEVDLMDRTLLIDSIHLLGNYLQGGTRNG